MDNQNNKRVSIKFSQNFTVNSALISDLVKQSSITTEDLIYEIGPGTGVITSELARASGRVVAIEIDKNLYDKLKIKFANSSNVEIQYGDFMANLLPKQPYKVFSNIPFNITAPIIKKLTESENPPEDTYLFVQNESADKFCGVSKETQASLLLKPWFDLSIVYRFKKNDFRPIPNVDIVLFRIEKRNEPLVALSNTQLYKDFVIYSFNQWKPTLKEALRSIFSDTQFTRLSNDLRFSSKAKPTELSFNQWLGLFNFFIKGTDLSKRAIVSGAENKLKAQQMKLDKIHRTRTDKNWKLKR